MTVHICRGVNRRYLGMVRATGCRKWIVAGPERRSKRRAVNDVLDKMLNSRSWKRGSVLFTADYYEPIAVLEINR